jgi:cellulose synthase/poly-beta-1,6-N-acetylglucosamine synthase-like glycosyltransferase
MTRLALLLALSPAFVFGYAYVAYPALLWLLAAATRRRPLRPDPAEWPMVSISVPVYNEERQIRGLIESLLAIDYPRDRLQILIISDCSSDATDEIVREYRERGIELLRVPERKGKTAAEQAAHPHLRGEIVVNTDASIRIAPAAVRHLVRALQDPDVGVASGRDVSVGDAKTEGNQGESGYVGYEMWVRGLETRLGGIVGSSGSLYAIRAELHRTWLPEMLSRDFASALIAREHGYRAVSVDEATCVVPRTTSLAREYRRKVRTMARGLDTLWYKRHLMNPVRHGGFALKLVSHKLARWLVYLLLPVSVFALAYLAADSLAARVVLGAALLVAVLGTAGIRWPANRRVPRVFAIPGFVVAANLAGLLAWLEMFRNERHATWEPTRRPA